MGGGKQDNESAIEQAKDEQISDFIRGRYKGATGMFSNVFVSLPSTGVRCCWGLKLILGSFLDCRLGFPCPGQTNLS
jgi:hypothetical protein